MVFDHRHPSISVPKKGGFDSTSGPLGTSSDARQRTVPGGQFLLKQIWLGVFIVLVSGQSTYQAQYHSICNDNFFKKSRFLQV